jgi:acyl-CoA thioester hydrolase
VYQTELKYRVLYAHTDKLGVVYYGKYFEYFEAGRSDMLRKLGYPYKELEQNNISLPVIESQCKYFSYAKYDDLLIIKTSLSEVPTVRIKIGYEVLLSGNIVVTGYTIHAFVNSLNMKPVRPPEDFVNLIKSNL